MKKIAFIFNTIPPLLSKSEDDVYVIVPEGSAAEKYAQDNFGSDYVITYKDTSNGKNHSEYGYLTYSDLVTQLKKYQITHILLPHRYSQQMVKWAKQYSITIQGPPPLLQKKLENKLFFDNILKSEEISSPPTVSITELNDTDIYVVQSALSYGMFGTHFCKGKEEVLTLAQKKKVLIRKYLNGPSYGITTIISRKGEYMFSAIRRQCFTYKNSYPKTFVGVQWTNDSLFPVAVQDSLRTQLKQLADTLYKLGYYGMANFDFVVYENCVYFLECNPRLSSATPQLFTVPGITTSGNPWKFFIDSFEKESENIVIKNAVSSNYNGALMDIDVSGTYRIKQIPQIGTYVFENNTLKMIDNQFNTFSKNKDAYFLIHNLPEGITKFRNDTFCTILSNSPLFEAQSGKRNPLGEIINNFILDTCLTS